MKILPIVILRRWVALIIWCRPSDITVTKPKVEIVLKDETLSNQKGEMK